MRRFLQTFLLVIAGLAVGYGVLVLLPSSPDEMAEPTPMEEEVAPSLPGNYSVMPEGGAARVQSEAFSGDTSIRMQRLPGADGAFHSVGFKVPAAGNGEPAVFSVAIKITELDGYVGLWMRQDSGDTRVAYVNSGPESIRTVQDWQMSEIADVVASEADTLSAGVFVMGSGEVFVDELALTIDGEAIETDRAARPAAADTSDASALNDLSPAQIEHIAQLVKVWGFLKYHHPAAMVPGKSWDEEFLRLLPQVMAAGSAGERIAVLSNWTSRLGEASPCAPCADALLPAHTAWILADDELGQDLSAYLTRLHKNRGVGNAQKYVTKGTVGQAAFETELAYANGEIADAQYRLLAVARYWNIVQYWFPYRDLIEEDWDAVLPRYLAEAAAADTDFAYYQTMVRLVAEIGDSHAQIPSHLGVLPPYGACDVAVELRFIDGQPMITAHRKPGDAAPGALQLGDILTQIDGKPIEALLAEMRPYYSASNIAAQRRDMAKTLLRGACGPVELSIDRDGRALSLSAERVQAAELNPRLPAGRPGEAMQILEDEIVYLKLSSARLEEVETYVERLRSARGVILDVRGGPGEFMPYSLGRWFAAAPTAFAKLTAPSFDTPGAFTWVDGPPPIPAAPDGAPLSLPIMILIDERTQSSTEYTAMAFRALPRAKLIGSQSAGANGNISELTLPGGMKTRISGIGVFYPDGTATQRIGLQPDILVRPSRAGIIAQRDEVLERAVKQIRAETE